MGAVLARFLRTLIPVGVMIVSGILTTNPKVLWLIPAFAALGKAIRDKFPTATWLVYLPF